MAKFREFRPELRESRDTAAHGDENESANNSPLLRKVLQIP
jgi:hypothetical protein